MYARIEAWDHMDGIRVHAVIWEGTPRGDGLSPALDRSCDTQIHSAVQGSPDWLMIIAEIANDLAYRDTPSV